MSRTALLSERLLFTLTKGEPVLSYLLLPSQGLRLVVAAGRSVSTPRPKRESEPDKNTEGIQIKIAALCAGIILCCLHYFYVFFCYGLQFIFSFNPNI